MCYHPEFGHSRSNHTGMDRAPNFFFWGGDWGSARWEGGVETRHPHVCMWMPNLVVPGQMVLAYAEYQKYLPYRVPPFRVTHGRINRLYDFLAIHSNYGPVSVFSRKSQTFPRLRALSAHAEGLPLEFSNVGGPRRGQKAMMMPLSAGPKTFDDICLRLDTIPYHKVTGRQTEMVKQYNTLHASTCWIAIKIT